jgi:hypothetical protein
MAVKFLQKLAISVSCKRCQKLIFSHHGTSYSQSHSCQRDSPKSHPKEHPKSSKSATSKTILHGSTRQDYVRNPSPNIQMQEQSKIFTTSPFCRNFYDPKEKEGKRINGCEFIATSLSTHQNKKNRQMHHIETNKNPLNNDASFFCFESFF